MNWFEKIAAKIRTSQKGDIPQGLWEKCPACGAVLFRAELERNLKVCPKCDHHMRMSARQRANSLFDPDTMLEIAAELEPTDILKFRDTKKYKDRLAQAQKKTGEKDALVVMSGQVDGTDIVAAIFEFGFIGGSMGRVVGEKFVCAVNAAIEQQCALVCFATSGGARMQESLISLMQMAKTSAALAKLSAQALPFIVVMVDPMMGGVSASLANLGDIHIAEPKALIGFAGPRVIEQTVRETLPAGFQRAEFLKEHGFVDMIVDRRQLRTTLSSLVKQLLH